MPQIQEIGQGYYSIDTEGTVVSDEVLREVDEVFADVRSDTANPHDPKPIAAKRPR